MFFRGWVKPTKTVQTITPEVYENNGAMFLRGMEFERWIDYTNGSTRTNGKNTGDLIENPAYVIESILRDWVFT